MIGGLLLAHHPPSQYDRCLLLAGRHVCRRCAVLYPLAFATMALSLAGAHWPASFDGTLLLLLPLPTTVEFILERLGVVSYRRGRQMLTTLLAAPALGRGFALYIARPTSTLFWGMVALFGGACLLALLLTRRRRA
jgi:hypothetical protein